MREGIQRIEYGEKKQEEKGNWKETLKRRDSKREDRETQRKREK